MLLPTKGLNEEKALLTVGADVLTVLDRPMSVTALWDRYLRRSRARGSQSPVAFDWFMLAVTTLFALGLVDSTPSNLLRRTHVPA